MTRPAGFLILFAVTVVHTTIVVLLAGPSVLAVVLVAPVFPAWVLAAGRSSPREPTADLGSYGADLDAELGSAFASHPLNVFMSRGRPGRGEVDRLAADLIGGGHG